MIVAARKPPWNGVELLPIAAALAAVGIVSYARGVETGAIRSPSR